MPHFEKMLYDNALLVRAYLQSCRSPGARSDLRVAVGETIDYLAARNAAPDRWFHSANDADSEGVEGLLRLDAAADRRHRWRKPITPSC